jgi:hypothetical protein
MCVCLNLALLPALPHLLPPFTVRSAPSFAGLSVSLLLLPLLLFHPVPVLGCGCGSSMVCVWSAQGAVLSYNDTVIRLVMPASIGSLDVTVWAFNQLSPTTVRVVIDPPVLTMAGPRLTLGTDGGEPVVLTGFNFGPPTLAGPARFEVRCGGRLGGGACGRGCTGFRTDGPCV